MTKQSILVLTLLVNISFPLLSLNGQASNLTQSSQDSALQALPESGRQLIKKVKQLTKAGAFRKAEMLLKQLTERYPNNLAVQLIQADLHQSMGLFARSKKEYETIKNRAPSEAQPLIALSQICLDNLDDEQALSFARQAVNVAPHTKEARLALAAALIATEATPEAEETLARLNKEWPSDAQTHYLAYKLALKCNHLAKANAQLKMALQLNPLKTEWLLEMSDLAKMDGDFLEAKESLIKLLSNDPSSIEALSKLAEINEFNLHEYDKAIDRYQEILSLDPDSVTALVGIDRCKQKLNDIAGLLKDQFWRFLKGGKMTFSSL